MASARCAYCDATLQPNSMFCAECGQLVPQLSRPPAPASLPGAARPTPAPGAVAAPAAPRQPIDPVPLPSLLPWQQAKANERPVVASAPPVLQKVELLFSTGQHVMVSGRAVIGRKPAQTAAATGVQAIEVLDDTRSVSRVHLYFELIEGRITVADAGSSNGSHVERAGQEIPLAGSGDVVEVVPGDRVWVGDISFEMRAAA